MSDDKPMRDEFEGSAEDLKKSRNQLSLLFGGVSLVSLVGAAACIMLSRDNPSLFKAGLGLGAIGIALGGITASIHLSSTKEINELLEKQDAALGTEPRKPSGHS